MGFTWTCLYALPRSKLFVVCIKKHLKDQYSLIEQSLVFKDATLNLSKLNVELYEVSLLTPLTPIIMHAAGCRIMVLHSTIKQYTLTVQLEYFDH